jgi:hypothetical protein
MVAPWSPANQSISHSKSKSYINSHGAEPVCGNKARSDTWFPARIVEAASTPGPRLCRKCARARQRSGNRRKRASSIIHRRVCVLLSVSMVLLHESVQAPRSGGVEGAGASGSSAAALPRCEVCRLAVPAPVPRLWHKTMGILARVTEAEAKAHRVAREPVKRLGSFERFAQRWGDAVGNIQGAPGVMFAVAGSCI